MTRTAYVPPPHFVLWGYHPAYASEPIKISAARNAGGLASEQKRRERQGFVTGIYRFRTEPVGLRLVIANLRDSQA